MVKQPRNNSKSSESNKKAVVSVINDLVTDQRVHKICTTLVEEGFDVLLAGRKKRDSSETGEREYPVKRMKLIFEKGPLFYAEFNLRLFLFLITKRMDLLYANDLDTLLPNYLISRLKGKPLIYDSHEFFTETPEVIHRPVVRKIWLCIEKAIFPKLKDVFTVSSSIANEYKSRYNTDVRVLRNVPRRMHQTHLKTRGELQLPEDKKIVLLQGSGINIQRGAEELVEAMPFTEGIILLVIGGGDVIGSLKNRAREMHLDRKIIFKPGMPYEELFHYTANSDLGITIDKDTNPNYRYSLPNKLFDYIQAGIPVLATPLPEIRKIVEEYGIGGFITDHDPRKIALTISHLLSDEEKMAGWKKNTKKAAEFLCWEKEKIVLVNVLKKYA
ncbi:MAG: glycosyltransferase [Bacteroidales bacterium]|nr:glycosyltransferase [Bacteroidales bacterium]